MDCRGKVRTSGGPETICHVRGHSLPTKLLLTFTWEQWKNCFTNTDGEVKVTDARGELWKPEIHVPHISIKRETLLLHIWNLPWIHMPSLHHFVDAPSHWLNEGTSCLIHVHPGTSLTDSICFGALQSPCSDSFRDALQFKFFSTQSFFLISLLL